MDVTNVNNGEIYGTWRIKNITKIKNHQTAYCICTNCGAEREIRLDYLKKRKPVCKCSQTAIDYTGRTFGHWKKCIKNDSGDYDCTCVCGNVSTLTQEQIQRRYPLSCGCQNKLRLIRQRTCQLCGKTFDGVPRAKYCNDCRIIKRRESSRLSQQRQKEGTAVKIGEKMECEICGKEIIRNGSLQRFCPECAKTRFLEMDRESSLKWYHEHKEKESLHKYHIRKIQKLMKCVRCGKEILRKSQTQKYCAECAELSKLDRLVKTHAPTAVIVCPICGKEFESNNKQKKYCNDCRQKIDNYYESSQIGETIICKNCGQKIIKQTIRQQYCNDCREKKREAFYKAGEIKLCDMCKKQITIKSPLQKYCDECARIMQIKCNIVAMSTKSNNKIECAENAVNNFGENVKRLLTESNMSQTDLANKLGIKSANVYNWISKGTGTSLKVLLDLYSIFGNEILPSVPPMGIVRRKVPIKPNGQSKINLICAKTGYSEIDIARNYTDISPAAFHSRYHNDKVNFKGAVDLIALFGFELVKKFYGDNTIA